MVGKRRPGNNKSQDNNSTATAKSSSEKKKLSRNEMALAVDAVNAGILYLDIEGRISFINRAAAELTGWDNDPEELIGKLQHELFQHSYADGTQYRWNKSPVYVTLKSGKMHNETDEVFWRRDASSFPVDFTCTPIMKDGKIIGAVVTFQDITQQNKIKAALNKNEGKFQSLIDSLLDGVITIDEEGKIESVNSAGEDLFGYSAEEIMGKSMKMLMPSPYSGDRYSYTSNYLKTGTKKIIGIGREAEGRHKDGSFFPLYFVLGGFQLDGKAMYTGILRDISKSKKLEKVEKMLKESEQNSKELVYIASHDLQVPLVSMIGYLNEIIENYSEKLDEEGLYALTRVKVNSERMHRLILQLLDISRLNTIVHPYQTFKPNKAVQEILEELELAIKNAGVEIKVGKMPKMHGDKSRLITVFRNLITNAINYQGKHIEIGYQKDNYYVKDDGIGIPEKQIKKIFRPGERLKQVDVEGSGMGLTFCMKVIEKHNGLIWAESEGTNRGATFYFKLSVPHLFKLE